VKKRILIVAAIVLAGLATLAIRVVVEGRSALADGDEAYAQHRVIDAIAGWESAARWYLPGAPHVDEAYDRLRNLAATDRRFALPAYRAIRSASWATRTLWTPHADDLDDANTAIANLSADDPEAASAGGADHAHRLAWQLGTIGRDPRPGTGAIALAILGIACWLAGMVWLVRRGIDEAGAVVRRPAIRAAALALVGLVVWTAGLYNA
jgi:hypothetical protein